MRRSLPPPLARAARWSGWIVLIWVVVFWRLGMPSFWDPGDEAHYAQATREMLASGDWLAPHYNGLPFFDKPVFFYWLQMIAFSLLGPSEFAARIVPAISAIALFAAVGWFGARIFDRGTGTLGALMLALLPATFALSSYAILDMTFTALLFGGLAAIVVSARRGHVRLQYAGYVLVGLAVLTKGPLALALSSVALTLAIAIAPEIRTPFWRLRWGQGLAIVVGISLPWFVYSWMRFGGAFIEGYLLRENIWLFTRGVGGPPGAQLSYFRVITIGMLPWTPVFAGRLVDIARGDRCSTDERLLWAWSAAVPLFFSVSHFKLDHYVYPAAPTLCLLAAHAWRRAREATSLRAHAGVVAGVSISAIAVTAAGLALLPMRDRASDDVWTWISVVAIALISSGALEMGRLVAGRFRPPAIPLRLAIGILATYSVALFALLPIFEHAKPVKPMAEWVANLENAPDRVGAYRMDRWNTSWRFYVDQPVTEVETPDALVSFLRQPGRSVCLMMQRDVDALTALGYRFRIEHAAPGLFVTSGRAITRDSASNWQVFVIVSHVAPPDRPLVPST